MSHNLESLNADATEVCKRGTMAPGAKDHGDEGAAEHAASESACSSYGPGNACRSEESMESIGCKAGTTGPGKIGGTTVEVTWPPGVEASHHSCICKLEVEIKGTVHCLPVDPSMEVETTRIRSLCNNHSSGELEPVPTGDCKTSANMLAGFIPEADVSKKRSGIRKYSHHPRDVIGTGAVCDVSKDTLNASHMFHTLGKLT